MVRVSKRRAIGFGIAALATIPMTVAVFGAPAALPDETAVARLMLAVERAEDVRAVKTLQISYSHYSQFGLWSEMAALFAADAEAIYGSERAQGKNAIAQYYLTNWGHGRQGLPPGGLHTQIDETPVITLSADRRTAKGRWHEFSMTGRFGGAAEWAQGIMENDYVKDGGVWKIARLHYYPVSAGPYETGWRNVGADLPIVPYHYTPTEAGVPIPPLAADAPLPALKGSAAQTLAALNLRIQSMNASDQVANLQNAFGYYTDRMMWDDAVDLFTADAVLEDAEIGVYAGPKSIRRFFDRLGPLGLRRGLLNDRPTFDLVVSVAPGGREARTRGIELREAGDMSTGAATLGLSVFENRFVKGGDGHWRIREMRFFPIMATDYYRGWGKSRLAAEPPPAAFAPDKPVPAADTGALADGAIPIFFQNHPTTGKAVTLPSGAKVVGANSLLPPANAGSEAAAGADLADAWRRLSISTAYDAVDNISHAFGNYIDDYSWKEDGALFAKDGWRGKYLVGFYIGPERIEQCERIELGSTPSPRLRIDIHWRTQPVIDVSADGKSARLRTRLFHLNSSDRTAGVFSSGMYPNDAASLEDGVWKLQVVAIDEPYFNSSSYAHGWAKERPRAAQPPSPPGTVVRPPAMMEKLIAALPPDVPLAKMRLRYHGFYPGDIIGWPDIKPMWFAYRNPVSGRVPANYCPDLKTCERDLDAAHARTAAAVAEGALPQFQLDPTWPKPLPNHWQIGPVTGVFVDRHDQIWINSQSDKLTKYDLALKNGAGDCCIASPRVMVFDIAGNIVKSWGGPDAGFEWPDAPHAIYVDHKENVWITANGAGDTHVLKFTNDGRFLLQIGKKGLTNGSNDTANLNRSAGIAVWPQTNEVFIADGYGNRRVIVFDADTGAYKRHWGAYGKRPEDREPIRKFDGEGATQFSTVHGLAITPDGIVWVADRVGNRIQQFLIDGTFVKEAFVARGTTSPEGTVYGFSFSPDPQMTYVYVADGSNKKVHILNRLTLQEVGFVGGYGGQMPGSFNHLHGTAVDSRGNLYTGEAAAGARIQRWLLKK